MQVATAAINRQLLRTIWPFLAVVLLLLGLSATSLAILSSVRAYIGGESIWSKGQKDAAFYLNLYAQTGNEKTYDQYARAIAYPLNLKQARLTLDRGEPNVSIARDALVASGVFPADVGAVIWVFRTFRHVSYFDEAVAYWVRGDALVEQLSAAGDEIHAAFAGGRPHQDYIDRLTAKIWTINAAVSPVSRAFADVLGAAFRKLVLLLLAINAVVAVVLVVLSAWHARRFITARLATESALRRSEARAKATLGSIGEAVISVGLTGKIEFINPAAERLLCRKAKDCANLPLDTLVSLTRERDRRPLDLIGAALADGGPDELGSDLMLTSASGKQTIVQAVTSVVRDASDAPTGIVLLLRNMSREREYISNLAWQATHDGLTGLLNRTEFERCLGASLDPDSRLDDSERAGALMVLDLDQFKVVNDTFGHAAGDAMLKEVALRIQQCLRERDVLCRLGGDEFGVLLRERDPAAAAQVGERVRKDLAAFKWSWGTHVVSTSVSIGVVDLRQVGLDVEKAMRFGDIACYMAKERGRDRVHLAVAGDKELNRHASEISWARRIKEALEHDGFRLYAQTICSTSSFAQTGGRLTAHRRNDKFRAEILLRMTGDSGKVIPPSVFMPAAERYGLMSAIDRWVVHAVFTTLANAEQRPEGQYSINLSGASVGDERFLEFLNEQFLSTGVPPASICFEVTETTAVANLCAAAHFIRELKKRGCKFALDDFGAGMSSFGYLKHLPVDYIKIDGGFIKDMLKEPVNREMVTAINDIAHSMGRMTIAEYVENEAILAALRDIGVDYVQGYHVGRPALWVRNVDLFTVS